MSALRKAGVWLGLVEDDDERDYDDRGYSAPGYRDRTSGYRDTRRSTRDEYVDEYDEEEDEDELPAVPRSRYPERGREPRSERTDVRAERAEPRYDSSRVTGSTVRPITRPVSSTSPSTPTAATPTTSAGSSGGRSSGLFGTRDNLALAPETETPPRAAVVPVVEEERRPAVHQITTLHPTTYNEARTIGEHFRDGTPVIMNLTEMDEADAKRLVDFAAGLAFGLRGTIERVTHRVFLLSPANVQVTAEEKAKIAEGGYHHS